MLTTTMPRTLIPVVLLMCQPLDAAELPIAHPSDVGISKDKLRRVVPALQKLVSEQKVAGAVTIVTRQGKVVLFEAVGKQDIEANREMARNTIFRIYSMTKPITSVATMMLVEQGKLALDDEVSKHLPEMKDLQVFKEVHGDRLLTEPSHREMTVQDLLRHTSGLTYGVFSETPVDRQYRQVKPLDRSGTLQDMARKLGTLPLLHQPGTRFHYGVSTDVLGRIVEVASGKTLDAFFRQHIFDPLDMRDTGFQVPDDKLDRFASNYGPQRSGGLRVIDEPAASRYRRMPTLLSGGGGLVSTARDYSRFCQMILNQGELDGVRLLRAESVAAMTTNQLPEQAYPIQQGDERPGVGFGLGFSVVVEDTQYTRQSRIGEFGWGGAASTHFWISPKDELAVVVLTQLMPFSRQAQEAVKPLVYDALRGE